ncbi:MAG: hypothetical protein ACR2FM_02380 [Candidatus Saccharimonadales bacterium]
MSETLKQIDEVNAQNYQTYTEQYKEAQDPADEKLEFATNGYEIDKNNYDGHLKDKEDLKYEKDLTDLRAAKEKGQTEVNLGNDDVWIPISIDNAINMAEGSMRSLPKTIADLGQKVIEASEKVAVTSENADGAGEIASAQQLAINKKYYRRHADEIQDIAAIDAYTEGVHLNTDHPLHQPVATPASEHLPTE